MPRQNAANTISLAQDGAPEVKPHSEWGNTDVLLQTKLYAPRLRSASVSRSDLVQQLNANAQARLILISAPAGFGKTTLIVEWLEQRKALQRRAALPTIGWLTLDDGDNDLVRFWRYVTAALRQDARRAGDDRPDTPGRRPSIEALVSPLLRELAASETPVVLVLDDYHLIHTETIHHSLNYFLTRLPPQAQLLILARADPPLPLARLRVQGQLLELRAADLRFSSDEIEQFLNRVMRLGLTPEDLATLGQRTEGWAAGLQLAAYSLRGQDPAARRSFIASFSGTNHLVLNYLLEEVLQQQPERVRDFLLQTSVLQRLSAPLCEAITGETTSDTILAQLERENLFLSPLDDAGRWYRYHPLFAEALQTQLRRRNPALDQELHRRASAWCVRNGHLERAINHALLSEAYESAAALVEEVAVKTWMQGELTTLLNWFDSLPQPIIAERPLLCLHHAWILFLHDRWEEAARCRRQVEQKLPEIAEPERSRLLGVWAAIGGAIAATSQEPDETIRLALLAQTHLPPEETTWRAVAAIDLGLAYLAQGKVEPAVVAFSRATDLCLAHDFTYLAFASLWHLFEALLAQGQLRRAAAAMERLQALENAPGGRALALHANAAIGLGSLACERNDPATAEALLQSGLERIWPGGQPRVVLYGRSALARLYKAKGKHDAACSQLQQASDMVRKLGMPAERKIAEAALAGFALDCSDRATAWLWQQQSGITTGDSPDFRHEAEHLVLARLLLAEQRFGEAAALLSRLLAAAERDERAGSELAVLALLSLAQAGRNKTQEAAEMLRRALAIAAPEGYARVFLDAGEEMADLLRLPEVRREAPDYVGHLLHAFAQEARVLRQPPVASLQTSESLPLDVLTQREQEILELIACGASNQEIADQLVVSVGTIKGHVNHIFSKLGVHSRTAAVARARELGWISA